MVGVRDNEYEVKCSDEKRKKKEQTKQQQQRKMCVNTIKSVNQVNIECVK